MKISFNWLKLYLDPDMTPVDLARLLTDCGLEVESMERYESVKGGLEGVVIGEVITCDRHPNADKLSLTTVDIGTDTLLPIVCGAPNVAAGQKVPVATVGTILYDRDKQFEIKSTKIRGEPSEGMICAEDELGLGASHEGIMVLDSSAKVGMTAKEYFNITVDHVFEIGLTPNRTDATSHIGVARDIAAAINQLDKNRKVRMEMPDVTAFHVDNHALEISVNVEDIETCPRYSGVTLTGVTVKESPEWLKNYLGAIGIRPINNIVDITNFVLMETGQPLHAFDADEVKGNRVVVRKARKGEKFITLDEVERELSEEDLMICNSEEGMCIAGVFGGLRSGVTAGTSKIFLESAHFNPQSIRKTSRLHSLQTDASFRFERGSDPNMTVYALKRAALLIRELTGAQISSEIKDIYPEPVGNWNITLTYRNVTRLIGKIIEPREIKNILSNLGMKVILENPEGLTISVPTFKVDVRREADVIEEILRIFGYNNVELPHELRGSLSFSPDPDPENIRNIIADLLCNNGFTEIMNNSLTQSKYYEGQESFDAAKSVHILNPLSSDLNVMRQSLLFGGLETIAYNQNRKISDLKLFEFGRVYKFQPENSHGGPLDRFAEHEHLGIFLTGRRAPESWRSPDQSSDVFDIKAIVGIILRRLGLNISDLEIQPVPKGIFTEGLQYVINQKIIVGFGTVSKKFLKDLDIKQDVFYAAFNWDETINQSSVMGVGYREIPRFPEVRRDLALLVDHSVPFADLNKMAFQTEKHLLKSVRLFDVYEGGNIGADKKSYAISFILQDEEKTLTDNVIEKTMQKLLRAFEHHFHATLR
jgi:phenylalanyl-tRNA synthetase beta chain